MPYPHYKKSGEPVPHNIFCTRRVLESIIRDVVHEQCPKVVRVLVISYENKLTGTLLQIEYINGTVTEVKLSDDSRVVSSVGVRLADGSSSQITCDMFVGTLIVCLMRSTGLNPILRLHWRHTGWTEVAIASFASTSR